MRGVVGFLVLGVAACSAAVAGPDATSAVSAPSELSLPLDARTLAAELTSRGIHTKADALAILPHAMKQRFVLVKNTGALGKASIDRPRVIHFAEDGRFVVASSGHKLTDDATANSLEILEEDPATHTFHMHTIVVDAHGVKLIADDDRCTGCHGTPARPIWGSYPNWPAAYGENDDMMSPAELASFATFTAMAANDPDYRHLEIHPSSEGFAFPTPYGYPNAVYGSVVGTRYALQLGARMLVSPLLPKLEHALVETELYCQPSAAVKASVDRLYAATKLATEAEYPARSTTAKIFRLLGVEPTTDLRLDVTMMDSPPAAWDPDVAPYDVGSDYLTHDAVLPLFEHVLANDAQLGALFASQSYALADFDRFTKKGDIAGMETLTSDAYYNAIMPAAYNYFEEPVMTTSKSAVCARLDALAQLP